jgi:hypothetical protein
VTELHARGAWWAFGLALAKVGSWGRPVALSTGSGNRWCSERACWKQVGGWEWSNWRVDRKKKQTSDRVAHRVCPSSDGGSFLDPSTRDELIEYIAGVDAFIDLVPQPPRNAESLYKVATVTLASNLPKIIGWDTISSEYFNNPVDKYIPYWGPPLRSNDQEGYGTRDLSELYAQLAR